MYKVIMVDDEKISLNMLEQIFKWKDYGFHISGVFTDAQTALKHIKDSGVDVVFTDIEMPNMNGLDFATEVRRILPNAKIVDLLCVQDLYYLRPQLS